MNKLDETPIFGDIGDLHVPEIDIDLIDFIQADETEETRYTLPKAVEQNSEQVMYSNALRMVKAIDITEGKRVDAFVSGDFIFGDFIEAFLTTKNGRCVETRYGHTILAETKRRDNWKQEA